MSKINSFKLVDSVLSFIIFPFLFGNCSVTTGNKESNCMNDSLVIDIPVNRADSNSINIRDKIEYMAGLAKIDTGLNGLQIRIGYAYSGNIEHLIILTNENENWSATLNTLEFNYKPLGDSLISTNRTFKKVAPKSGWTVFTDSLIAMGILDLPDMSSIPDYELGMDGTFFTVDFAKCRRYRYYSYQNPLQYSNEFWQAMKVVEISNLIEQELNFNRFSKSRDN